MSAPPFVVTFWTHETARFKDEREIDKVGLANLIRSEHAEQKNNLRWLKLARFGNALTARKSLRHDANVLSVYGIEADYDGEQITFEDACNTLRHHGIDSIVYTSPSHSIEKPRWRVLCILSTHYPPNERAKFVARLQGVFGGVFSEESFTLSQSYYFGYVGNGALPPQHQVELIDGEFIDLLDELDAGAIGRLKKKTNGDGYDGERPEFAELVRMFLGGEAFHPLLAPIIGKLANEMPRHILLQVMRGLFDVALKSRPDIGPRWKEVVEVTDYVYEKIAEKKAPLPPGVTFADFLAYAPEHNYIFTPIGNRWPAASVNGRLPWVGGIKPSAWLDRNQPVEQMTWMPGEPALIKDKLIDQGGWKAKAGTTVFNLYRPSNIVPGNPRHASLWVDHVRYVYPEEADHIIKWLAHRCQHPEIKINHALLLGGSQGIGKDTLLAPVIRTVGFWNVQSVSPAEVLGRFTPHRKSVLLIISEARDLGDVNRPQFYEHMKVLTAAPPDVLLVDEKNTHPYYIPNLCGVVITTNHKAGGIFLTDEDRRHFVCWSPIEKAAPPDYWNKIYDWYDSGGYEDVAAYLLTLDLSDFDPKAPPPKTAAFWEICSASQMPEVGELIDAINAIGNPLTLTIDDLTNLTSAVDPDFVTVLKDRKSRRLLAGWFEKAKYRVVWNPSNPSQGLWIVNGKRKVVYGKSSCTDKELHHDIRRRNGMFDS
jgi:hypothetical protein